MMADPSIREGYVQASVARGLESAGSNAAGSMAGFMGMGMGMQAGGGFMGAASAANMEQMKLQHESAAKTEPSRKALCGAATAAMRIRGNSARNAESRGPGPECGAVSAAMRTRGNSALSAADPALPADLAL